MDANQKRIKRTLEFDPLHFIENMTGERIDDDPDSDVNKMALAAHLKHSEQKEAILESAGDTTFNMDVEPYKEKIEEDFGFDLILEETFTGDGDEERCFVHWNNGLLLFWDTFWGSRNKATLYSNAIVDKDRDKFLPTKFSGGTRDIDGDRVWSGYVDAREALGFKIARLLEWSEEVLEYWRELPTQTYLINWAEYRYSDNPHTNHQKNRVERLPDWLCERILTDELDYERMERL